MSLDSNNGEKQKLTRNQNKKHVRLEWNGSNYGKVFYNKIKVSVKSKQKTRSFRIK